MYQLLTQHTQLNLEFTNTAQGSGQLSRKDREVSIIQNTI